MRAATELFLWEMLSIAGELYRPSFRFAGGSFEGWAYRKGLLRQMQRLEAEAFLERQPGGKGDRVYRLTSKGRLAAFGGKDPDERWNRSWDGRWRLLMFDLPQSPQTPRVQLRRALRERGLGCLQGSVWLSPDPLDGVREELRGDRHPSSLLLFEGDTVGGEKAAELVREAWNFNTIRLEWTHLERTLEQGRIWLEDTRIDEETFREWRLRERADWKQVIEIDPFLPSPLLPSGYRGRKVWKKRLAFWKQLSAHLRAVGYSGKQTRDVKSTS